MAIVFVSAKQRQKSFIWGISLALVLLVVVIFLAIFLPGFLNPMPTLPPSGQPGFLSDLAINFSGIDSDKVKNLDPFLTQEKIFTYVVLDKNGRRITGDISADTQDGASALLQNAGFKIISLSQMVAGRSDPFVSY